MELNRKGDFELISLLAECVASLDGDDFDFYQDMEEMVYSRQKLSAPRRKKIVNLIQKLHQDLK